MSIFLLIIIIKYHKGEKLPNKYLLRRISKFNFQAHAKKKIFKFGPWENKVWPVLDTPAIWHCKDQGFLTDGPWTSDYRMSNNKKISFSYRAFHIFMVKFGYGCLILGFNKYLQLPQLPQKLCSIQKWLKNNHPDLVI